MANFLKGFLSNVLQGTLSPKGNLADFSHAAKLYNSNVFRLAPKTKFLYHVVFNINPNALKSQSFKSQHISTLNLLVKTVDLPSFKVSTEAVHQYNRKKQIQTRLDYDPVSIAFHDDNAGITTQLWALYYGYYFADSAHGNSFGSVQQSGVSGVGGFTGFNASSLASLLPGKVGSAVGSALGALSKISQLGSANVGGNSNLGSGSDNSNAPAAYQRNTYLDPAMNRYRYGLDNNSSFPFFTSIQIFQLSRRTYQSYTLINPIITSWKHESLDQSDTTTPSANTMTIAYEAVIYGAGAVKKGNPKGFATEYYDQTPSPLSLLGGGTTSLFGEGGVVGGISDVLGDLTSGKAFSNPSAFLGTLIKGANTYNNAKKLSKEGIRQEGFGILKTAIGATTGVNVSGVANIFVPKSGGSGQSRSTPASAVADANKSSLSASQISNITSNPAASQAALRQARAVGALPLTATINDLGPALSAGNNPKLNGIARKISSGTPS